MENVKTDLPNLAHISTFRLSIRNAQHTYTKFRRVVRLNGETVRYDCVMIV